MTRRRTAAQARSFVVAVTVAALLVPTLAAERAFATALPTECAQFDTTVTCTYTSGDNTFVVPDGVASIHVTAVGGKGGFIEDTFSDSGPGRGAVVAADLAVTGGSSLHAVVGGNAAGEVAGANGGGSGGAGDFCDGAAGGGASDLRTDTTLASRVLVAAGGGGAGCPGLSIDQIALYEVSNGGDAGAAGTPATTFGDSLAGTGGGAGCASELAVGCGDAGAGGQGLAGPSGEAGSDGALGAGGAGGGFDHSGGGGGGGWYGGGGGGAGGQEYVFTGDVSTGGAAGGGGGGSSLVPSGGTVAVDTTGIPKVAISYAAPVVTAFNVASATSPDGISVVVTFDAPPSADEATILAHYSIPGLSLSGTPSLSGSTVTIATSAQASQLYTVSVTDVTRASDGEPLLINAATFTGPNIEVCLPSIGLTPSSLDFGDRALGSTSSVQLEITLLSDDCASDVAIDQLEIAGVNASDFALPNDPCSNSHLIGVGASCVVDVTFTPSAAGDESASVVVPTTPSSSWPDPPLSVGLSGHGSSGSGGGGGTAPSADVRVTVTGPTAARKGAQVTYVITISNVGPDAAHNVVLGNSVPAGAKLLGITTSQGRCGKPSRGTLTCALGDLASGGNAGGVVTIRLTAKVGGTVTDLATAHSTSDAFGAATADPDPSNNAAQLTTTVTR